MHELVNYRPGYAVVAPPRPHGGWVADAHRVVRTAVAIGSVLAVTLPVLSAARRAVVATENGDGRYLPEGASAVARLCRAVVASLEGAIDRDGLPAANDGGERLRDEAATADVDGAGRPDFDRVFKLDEAGRVRMAFGRMSLPELRAMLPAVAALLERAASEGLEVELVEAEPEVDDPFALHT